MSKFIDRLKKVSQPPPPPMGFGAAKNASERPKIQLVAVTGSNAASFMGQLSMVDAVLLTSIKKNIPEKPWGLRLKKGDPAEVDQVLKAKADFVVLSPEGEILSADTAIGKILEIDPTVSDIMMRAANELPVDAFLVNHNMNGPLTWSRLTMLYRTGGLLTKPVLVSVAADISRSEIQNIWDAGICGLLVEAADDSAVAALNKIREIINGLPYPVKKKKDSISAVLPGVSVPVEDDAEPDEDDEDDE